MSSSNAHARAGYQGYLVADAHVVYDHLYQSGEVTEVNCWAHCRRYFFKALDSDPDRAKIALGLIGSLFKIERSLQTAARKKREQLRAKHSKPIVERFQTRLLRWCAQAGRGEVDTNLDQFGIQLWRKLRGFQNPLLNAYSCLRTRKLAVTGAAYYQSSNIDRHADCDGSSDCRKLSTPTEMRPKPVEELVSFAHQNPGGNSGVLGPG